jgi:hypothetical protein
MGLVGSRYFRRPIEQERSTIQMECYGARHHRFDLILLRAMPSVTFTMRMAWGRAILAGLHNAAGKTSCVSEQQSDREQDQSFAEKTRHFLSA